MAEKILEGVIATKEEENRKKKIEAGVLDTIQSLDGEKIRRRDKNLAMSWYRFLVIMLIIGSPATLGWVYNWGYWNGQSSVSQAPPSQLPPAPAADNSTPPAQQEMTVATVKAALTETVTILDSAGVVAGKVRAGTADEAVTKPLPTPVPLLPLAGEERKQLRLFPPSPPVSELELPERPPKTPAELANERLEERLRREAGIQ